jgi:hypothetical protein
MSKKRKPLLTPGKKAPMGAERIVWAMNGECPLPLPRPKGPGGGLVSDRRLLQWLAEVRQLCLASGAFLTAPGAVAWSGLWPPEYDHVYELFVRADEKAGLDYW